MYLRWCPVFVPHNVGGSLPVGVVIAKESVHNPVVDTSVMSKCEKSNLFVNIYFFLNFGIYPNSKFYKDEVVPYLTNIILNII